VARAADRLTFASASPSADFTRQNGTGGKSIYGEKFADEFTEEGGMVKHTVNAPPHDFRP
jgi:hypothetical protein